MNRSDGPHRSSLLSTAVSRSASSTLLHRSAAAGSGSAHRRRDLDRLVLAERGLESEGDLAIRPDQRVADHAPAVVDDVAGRIDIEEVMDLAGDPVAGRSADRGGRDDRVGPDDLL